MMLRPTTGDRLNMNSFECWVIVLLTRSVLLEKHSFMHYCLIISNKLKIYYSSLLLLPGKVSGHLKEQLQAHLHTCHHCSSLLTSKVFSKCYFQGVFYCYNCEKRIAQNVTTYNTATAFAKFTNKAENKSSKVNSLSLEKIQVLVMALENVNVNYFMCLNRSLWICTTISWSLGSLKKAKKVPSKVTVCKFNGVSFYYCRPVFILIQWEFNWKKIETIPLSNSLQVWHKDMSKLYPVKFKYSTEEN